MAMSTTSLPLPLPLRVCCYGSSSPKTLPKYLEASCELGKLLALRGCVCVTGAGRYGCMQAVQDGARGSGGETFGVIHGKFLVDGDNDAKLDTVLVAKGDDLTERKKLLIDNSDCIIVLPGGVGTFDEMWDSISHRSLGMKDLKAKPITLLNIDGYYDGSIAQITRAFNDGLLYGDLSKYLHVSNTPQEALDYVMSERSNASVSTVDDNRLKARTPTASSSSLWQKYKAFITRMVFGRTKTTCASCGSKAELVAISDLHALVVSSSTIGITALLFISMKRNRLFL